MRAARDIHGKLRNNWIVIHPRVYPRAHQVFEVEGLLDEVQPVEVVAPELVLLHHLRHQLVPEQQDREL